MRRGVGIGRPSARGVTLIELLVVVLLIGLMVSFVVLSVGGGSPRERQREEAQRLFARMDLAREEAVMRARSLGIRFDNSGYQFLERANGQWQQLTDDDLLHARELPDPLSIEVEIDDVDIAFGGGADDKHTDKDAEDDTDEDDNRPQVLFLPAGEIVPAFSIRLLSADTTTEFRVEPGDEQWLDLSERRF